MTISSLALALVVASATAVGPQKQIYDRVEPERFYAVEIAQSIEAETDRIEAEGVSREQARMVVAAGFYRAAATTCGPPIMDEERGAAAFASLVVEARLPISFFTEHAGRAAYAIEPHPVTPETALGWCKAADARLSAAKVVP